MGADLLLHRVVAAFNIISTLVMVVPTRPARLGF